MTVRVRADLSSCSGSSRQSRRPGTFSPEPDSSPHRREKESFPMPATSARRRSFVAVSFMLLTTMVVTLMMILSTATQADALTRQERSRKVHHGLRVAIAQVGDPYRYGAAGPNAFDCSGLTMFAYGKAGLRLPRSSDAQARVRAPHSQEQHASGRPDVLRQPRWRLPRRHLPRTRSRRPSTDAPRTVWRSARPSRAGLDLPVVPGHPPVPLRARSRSPRGTGDAPTRVTASDRACRDL